jgi:hypothetical protein
MVSRCFEKRVDVWRCEVGQRIALEVAPEHFYGVKLGSIRWEVVPVDSFRAGEMTTDELGAVGGGTVPDNQEWLLDLSAQLAKKCSSPLGGDIGVGIEGKVKSYAFSVRWNSQSSDGRHLSMGSPCSPQYGRAPAQSPGASYQGSHQEATLIDKDKVRLQLTGFFLSCGQSTAIQRRMARSFRSRARASGFCGLKPSPRSKRPI